MRRVDKGLGSLGSLGIRSESRAAIQRHYPLHAGSKFLDGSHGRTHYWMSGKDTESKRVVLVHGISGTWQSMPLVVERLGSEGFSVLCFDLFGRGYSDTPMVKYNATLFAGQLDELLQHVGWEKTHIIGYSLGGAIAAHFAAITQPHKVQRLALVAPSGLRETLPSPARLITTPLGSLWAKKFGRPLLSRLSQRNHNHLYKHSDHMKHFAAVQDLNILHNPGFMHAYVETVRDGPIRGMAPTYAKVHEVLGGDRICCVWGNRDTVVSFQHDSKRFRELCPDALFVELDGAGHSVLAETPNTVLDPIVTFLNQK